MTKGGLKDYRRDAKIKRKQNNVILIICCGETEKEYFNEFKLDLGEIKLVTIRSNCTPKKMVYEAIKMKKEKEYRQIWCVFDKDEFKDFDEAIFLADKNEIEVAYSNQAFELWFIMHFERIIAPLNRNRYKEYINKYLRIAEHYDYDKPYRGIYKKISQKTEKAIENAKFGHQTHKSNGGKPSDWESCTTVYRLVSELRKWKK